MTKAEFDNAFHKIASEISDAVSQDNETLMAELSNEDGLIDLVGLSTYLSISNRKYTNNLVYFLFLALVVEPY